MGPVGQMWPIGGFNLAHKEKVGTYAYIFAYIYFFYNNSFNLKDWYIIEC